jgi:hypothetical protein
MSSDVFGGPPLPEEPPPPPPPLPEPPDGPALDGASEEADCGPPDPVLDLLLLSAPSFVLLTPLPFLLSAAESSSESECEGEA